MLIKFHGIQNIQVDVLTIDACAGKDKNFYRSEISNHNIPYFKGLLGPRVREDDGNF